MDERLRRGEGFTEEIVNYGKDYSKDDRSYWLSVEVQPIRDEQGRITNFLAIESGITARRAAQQRLAIQFDVSRGLLEAGHQAEGIRRVLETICENLGWQVGQVWRLSESWCRTLDQEYQPINKRGYSKSSTVYIAVVRQRLAQGLAFPSCRPSSNIITVASI